MPFGVGERRRLHQQCLETDEHLPGEGLEPALGLVAGIDGLDGILESLDARETGRAYERRRVEAEPAQMRLRRLDGFDQRLHPLFDRRDDLLSAAVIAVIAERILRQGLPQAFQHAVVVDDQAEILAGIHPVRPRDRLHQAVRFHGLVDVERRKALDIEPGQPHGADDGDAEGMLRIFERGLHLHPLAVGGLEALLDQVTVRNDVEAPFPEVPDLVLRLADDDPDDGPVEPVRLRRQL